MKVRIRTREVAVHIIYQMDIRNEDDYEKLMQNYDETLDKEYLKELFEAMIPNLETIDQSISGNLKEWRLERIAKMELAILRVAVTEILHLSNIPFKTSVDEAVKLAKLYMSGKSGRFINGVLKNYMPA